MPKEVRIDLSRPPDGVYVAKRSCGCTVAACTDRPETKKDTAKSVAEWIAAGLTVSYRESGGKNPFHEVCADYPHEPKPKAQEVIII